MLALGFPSIRKLVDIARLCDVMGCDQLKDQRMSCKGLDCSMVINGSIYALQIDLTVTQCFAEIAAFVIGRVKWVALPPIHQQPSNLRLFTYYGGQTKAEHGRDLQHAFFVR